MNPQEQVCHNPRCWVYARAGAGQIVIHSRRDAEAAGERRHGLLWPLPVLAPWVGRPDGSRSGESRRRRAASGGEECGERPSPHPPRHGERRCARRAVRRDALRRPARDRLLGMSYQHDHVGIPAATCRGGGGRKAGACGGIPQSTERRQRRERDGDGTRSNNATRHATAQHPRGIHPIDVRSLCPQHMTLLAARSTGQRPDDIALRELSRFPIPHVALPLAPPPRRAATSPRLLGSPVLAERKTGPTTDRPAVRPRRF